MTSAESVDVRIARLEEKFDAFAETVSVNYRSDEAHRAKTDTALGKLQTVLDEWSGVRKTLVALGTLLLGLGTVVGAFVGYFWPHTK